MPGISKFDEEFYFSQLTQQSTPLPQKSTPSPSPTLKNAEEKETERIAKDILDSSKPEQVLKDKFAVANIGFKDLTSKKKPSLEDLPTKKTLLNSCKILSKVIKLIENDPELGEKINAAERTELKAKLNKLEKSISQSIENEEDKIAKIVAKIRPDRKRDNFIQKQLDDIELRFGDLSKLDDTTAASLLRDIENLTKTFESSIKSPALEKNDTTAAEAFVDKLKEKKLSVQTHLDNLLMQHIQEKRKVIESTYAIFDTDKGDPNKDLNLLAKNAQSILGDIHSVTRILEPSVSKLPTLEGFQPEVVFLQLRQLGMNIENDLKELELISSLKLQRQIEDDLKEFKLISSIKLERNDEGKIVLDPVTKKTLYNKFLAVKDDPVKIKQLKSVLEEALINNEDFEVEISRLIAFTDLLLNWKERAALQEKIDSFLQQKVSNNNSIVPQELSLNEKEIELLLTFPNIGNIKSTLKDFEVIEPLQISTRPVAQIFKNCVNFACTQYQLVAFLYKTVSKMGDLYLEENKAATGIPNFSFFVQEGFLERTERKIAKISGSKLSFQDQLKRQIFRINISALLEEKPKKKIKVFDLWRNIIGNPKQLSALVGKKQNVWASLFEDATEESDHTETASSASAEVGEEEKELPPRPEIKEDLSPLQVVYKTHKKFINKLMNENFSKMKDETFLGIFLVVNLMVLQVQLKEKGVDLKLPNFFEDANFKTIDSDKVCEILYSFLKENDALNQFPPLLEKLHGKLVHAPTEVKKVEEAAAKSEVKKIPAKRGLDEISEESPVVKTLNPYLYKLKNEKGENPFRNVFYSMVQEAFKFEESQNKDWEKLVSNQIPELSRDLNFLNFLIDADPHTIYTWNLLRKNPAHLSFKPGTLTTLESEGMGGAYLLREGTENMLLIKINAGDLFGPLNRRQSTAFLVDGVDNENLQKIMPDLLESLNKITSEFDSRSSLKTSLTRANLQTRPGIPYGSGALNEALASEIAGILGMRDVTIFTGLAIIEAPDFILPSEMLESNIANEIRKFEPTERRFLCSIQPFKEGCQTLSDLSKSITTSKIIPPELRSEVFEQQISHRKIERILIFEMVTGECDPNKGNYLVAGDDLRKIDSALIFSELESDFAYGQETRTISLFVHFPDALTTPISEDGKNEIREIFAKQDKIIAEVRKYRKRGNVQKAIDNFKKRIATLERLCRTNPDVTLGELYSSMGVREQIEETVDTDTELTQNRAKPQAAWLEQKRKREGKQEV